VSDKSSSAKMKRDGQPLLFSDDWTEGSIRRYSGKCVPHPIPYQGSKRYLAGKILPYFPPNAKRLVEPFAGSAAISLASAYSGIAHDFWINDAHDPLVALWREIVNNPEDLCAKYASLWREQMGHEREYYDQVREKFNQTHRPEYFLYLLARCVKAVIRYNSDGEFNNSPDNRRKGARPDAMRARVLGASKLLRGRTLVTGTDYSEVLANCGTDDLIYMDPPYQGVCGRRDNRYAPQFDHGSFCRALAELNRKGCMYLVSYDGRTGDKKFGRTLPASLRLRHTEIHAGRSSQATLLGRNHDTYESLYLSPALVEALAVTENVSRAQWLRSARD
jgi:DNA adenine methylase